MGLPALSVDVDAKLDKFNGKMNQLGGKADQAVSAIEGKFAAFNPSFSTQNYNASLTGMVVGAASTFGGIAGIAGLAFAAVIAGVVQANKYLADMDSAANRAGLSLRRFQEYKFGAGAIGVSDTDFSSSIDRVAENLQRAKFEANDLNRVMAANGVPLKDTNGKLVDMDKLLRASVDVIQRAPSLQDALQMGQMIGLTRDFSQRIFESSGRFLQLASEANKAGAVIDDATIKKAKEFDTEWNKASSVWGAQMKSAVAGVLPLLNEAVNGAVKVISAVQSAYSFIKNIQDFYRPPDIASLSKGKIENELAEYRRIRDELQKAAPAESGQSKFNRYADLVTGTRSEPVERAGEALNPSDALKANVYRKDAGQSALDAVNDTIKRLEEAQKKLDGTVAGKPDKGNPSVNPGQKVAAEARDQFDKGVDSITKRTATINADTAAVFQNNAAQAQFRAEFQLLTAIMRDKGEVDQKQIDTYERLRQSMSAQQALAGAGITLNKDHANSFLTVSQNVATATAKYDQAKESLDKINSASQQFGSGLSTAFGDAVLESKKLNDVLQSLLKTMGRAGINSLFASFFNAPASGGLSPFTAALGLGGIGRNAEGTDNWGGGPTWVGEKGPEILNVPKGAQIIPNNVATRSGGGNSFALTVSLAGANGDAAIRQMVAQGTAQGARAVLSQVPGLALKAVNEHLQRVA
jgi:hypothetical protein